MISKPKNTSQLGFYSTFDEQLDNGHPLYILAGQIRWQEFENAFAQFGLIDSINKRFYHFEIAI